MADGVVSVISDTEISIVGIEQICFRVFRVLRTVEITAVMETDEKPPVKYVDSKVLQVIDWYCWI
jgi:hypothetical protein